MSIQEAIEHGKDQLDIFGGEHREFIELAIKSLEAWERVKNICTIQVADTFRNFEEYDRGSHAREKIRSTCREITILLKGVSE